MPPIPLLFWGLAGTGVGVGTAAGIYVVADTPRAILKENILPLAIIGGATFLALRYIEKKA